MTEQEQKAYIQKKLSEIQVIITEEQATQFLLYYQMLVETNRVKENYLSSYTSDIAGFFKQANFVFEKGLSDIAIGKCYINTWAGRRIGTKCRS